MSDVISIFGTERPADPFAGKGYGVADFPVATRPLLYFNDDTDQWYDSSKIAVVRTDTMDELGVHGKNYKPVAPRELIDTQRAIIMRSDLNTDGITETIECSHNGAATFVKYRLPEHSFATPDGDTAELTFLGITSLNSTFSFFLSVGARQSACFNGQVFVSGEAGLFKARHTKNLDINAAARSISKSIDIYDKERELWAQMYQTQVTQKQVMFTFAEAAGCLDLVRAAVNESGASWSAVFDSLPRMNSTLTYLVTAWKEYSNKMGYNQWAVYNTLTDWSTHAPASTKKSESNIASVKQKRSDVVRKVCTSDVFRIAA